MATQTPPRLSVDRDNRPDLRMTPTPTPGTRYQRPSFIPLPTHLSTPSASNGTNGNLGARASTSLLVQRPNDIIASRSSYDDARTGRSSSLSARTNSPALGSYISGLARPSFSGFGEHAANGNGHSRTYSGGGLGTADSGNAGLANRSLVSTNGLYADETCHEASSARSSVAMAPANRGSLMAAAAINGAGKARASSFSSNSAAVVDDADDGQRELPVKVAVRIRPLVVSDGSVGGSGDNGGWGSTRGALASCLEVQPKASVRMNPPSSSAAAGAVNGMGNGQVGGEEMAGLGGFVRPSSIVGASGGPRTFKYDYAFGPEASQSGVYEAAIAPLLARFVEGYNVTVLAYGQTSSGKTFTMGTDAVDVVDSETTGIVPRALSFLFSWMQAQPGGAAEARVSFIEVYNEELIDLVAVTQYRGVRPPIFIREDSKGNIQWTGVKEVPVGDTRSALSLLAAGSRERQTSSTRMNGKSSRSHAIYSVTLVQTRVRQAGGGPVQIISKLHFVDLAGSERLKKTLAEGERKREGISINSGLLALGNVISALGDSARTQATHVPYRDSKLTHMLRDSLGGTAQTLLIACVSAAEANAAETLNTLKYASRARNIRNCGGVNMVAVGGPSAAEVQALRAQVRKLRANVRDLEERLQARDLADEQRADERAQTPAPRGLLSPPSSKIPTMAAAVQRRAQTAEELASLRTRNQALEAELEQLNDTYTELLLKFNDACRDIEERQNEGFARDQRLRDREQEIRKLTGHSRHSRRIASVAESDARRSVLLGSPTDAEASAERVRSLVDVGAPELPSLARLRDLQRAESRPASSSPKMVIQAIDGNDAAPGAAEFDAMMEEYDSNIHALEDELHGAQETIEGLRLQLTMQETKATFAEKLNTSQAVQIETLRVQLAKAREAALEEEERRRAIEAELEESTIAAETQLEAANDAWRQELSQADELWNERWDAVHAEHALMLEQQTQEIAHLRRELHSNLTGAEPAQMLSPPSTAHEEHDSSENAAAHVQMQLEADLSQSLADVRRLEADIDHLRIRALDAEARASAAEQALAALSARMAETTSAKEALAKESALKSEAIDKAEQRIAAVEKAMAEAALMAEERIAAADKALASATQMAEERIVAAEKALAEQRVVLAETSDKTLADASVQTDRPAVSHKAAQFVSAESDAVPELRDFSRSHSELPRRASDKIILCARNSISLKEPGSESPAEQRLRSMRHRHSTAAPPRQQRSPAPAADKFASYPELRLAARNGPPLYDDEHIQTMLRDAAAEVDRQSDQERERQMLLNDVAVLREAKKELQERNSQMQNLMRELGDRLVSLAEENDLLEAKAAERDALALEVQRLAQRVRELETDSRERSLSRPQSQHSFHSAPEHPGNSAEASFDLIQLQSRLNIAEAELTEALLTSDEHRAHASQLLHELEQHKIRLAEMEEDLAATMHQLDAVREEHRQAGDAARRRDADAQDALAKQTDLANRLRDSLTLSEDRGEEARLTADRFANELMRVQAEAKNVAEQLDVARKQLDDAQAMAATEARDRDVWKGRCQDLRDEVNELRARRRQSKIL
ncbi:hypothetical protein J3B02_001550, partial [Coemansia erecta]